MLSFEQLTLESVRAAFRPVDAQMRVETTMATERWRFASPALAMFAAWKTSRAPRPAEPAPTRERRPRKKRRR